MITEFGTATPIRKKKKTIQAANIISHMATVTCAVLPSATTRTITSTYVNITTSLRARNFEAKCQSGVGHLVWNCMRVQVLTQMSVNRDLYFRVPIQSLSLLINHPTTRQFGLHLMHINTVYYVRKIHT